MNAKLIFKATLCLLGAGTFSQTAVAQDIYDDIYGSSEPVSYTHLRAHET